MVSSSSSTWALGPGVYWQLTPWSMALPWCPMALQRVGHPGQSARLTAISAWCLNQNKRAISLMSSVPIVSYTKRIQNVSPLYSIEQTSADLTWKISGDLSCTCHFSHLCRPIYCAGAGAVSVGLRWSQRLRRAATVLGAAVNNDSVPRGEHGLGG